MTSAGADPNLDVGYIGEGGLTVFHKRESTRKVGKHESIVSWLTALYLQSGL